MTIPFFVFKEILINMDCGCNNNRIITPDCDMSRWEVQCSSYIEDASNYYTKKQVDDLIEGASGCCITPEEVDEKIESATSGLQETLVAGDNIIISGNVISAEVPSLSGYATEQWVNEQGYLKTVEPLKTINGETLIGEGNIVITGSSVTVDDHLDGTSTNPVQNKVIVGALNDKLDASAYTPTDLSNYYTTAQTVNLVESAVTIVEAEIPSLSGYATEQWVLDKNYITGVDLSDYVTKEELPTDIASKQWVVNQNFASYAQLMQYVMNLQNQIDALREEISGCCSDTGTTLYRWVTMTGASDYTCSGTTKMTKEEEEQSTDGGNSWVPTGNYRPGSTILEENCLDCGYTPEPSNMKYKGDYNNAQSKYVECDGVPSITVWEVQNDVPSTIDNLTGATFYACCEYIANNILGAAYNIERVEIKEGVISVGGGAFQTSSALTTVIIPNSVKYIDGTAFGDCPNLSALTIGSGVTEIGEGAFSGDSSISNDLNLPNVTKINTAAFQGCSSLHSVNIGSGVTRIQGSAFRGCSGLTSITVNADVPPSLGARAFEDSTCNIYVPSGSVETYKTTYPWNGYASRLMPLI